MGQLDATIVLTAFPTLQRDLHSNLGGVEWVSLAYLLALVGLVTALGHLADIVGRKLLYIYGFALFIVATGLCGVAPNLAALIVFRALQGVGAAMLQANSVALIVQAMPRHALGRGIGIQGTFQALGLAVGPALGGLLLAAGGWRLIFFVNIPFGLVGIALAWFFLPRSRDLLPRQPVDWLGMALFLAAAAGVLVGLAFGDEAGWGSPQIVATLVGAAVCLGALLWWERRSPAPMLALGLFRNRALAVGVGGGLLASTLLFGILFAATYYLQGAAHLGLARSGLELMVLPVALGLAAPVAGRMADRLGARPLTVGGMTLVAAAMLAVTLARPGGFGLGLELAVAGVGLGAFTPPNSASIMASVPRTRSGMASGILNTTRGLGTSLGVALTGVVFGLAAGTAAAHASSPSLVTRGFSAASLFLLAVALLAALLALLAGPRPVNLDRVPNV
jgi:EmrB/QacA subfamily drug resistance transporter